MSIVTDRKEASEREGRIRRLAREANYWERQRSYCQMLLQGNEWLNMPLDEVIDRVLETRRSSWRHLLSVSQECCATQFPLQDPRFYSPEKVAGCQLPAASLRKAILSKVMPLPGAADWLTWSYEDPVLSHKYGQLRRVIPASELAVESAETSVGTAS